jgi:hypothetical protein
MATKKTPTKKNATVRTANSARTVRGRPFEKGHRWAWKPGQSGNPAGRPVDQITPHLRAIAKEQYPGQDEKTYGRMVAQALYERALMGDVQAIKEILDRLDGKSKQTVAVETEDHRREFFENAIERMMTEGPMSRDEAVAAMIAVYPGASEWLN